MTSTNQRWYTSRGSLLFVHSDDVQTGEVRCHIVDNGEGRAYIMAGSPGPTTEQAQWIANQLNGAVDNEQYAEDFAWVHEVINELLVPDERCAVAWGACRGSMKNSDDERFDDTIALIIAADLYPDPEHPDSHFRIATFVYSPWESRGSAVEQALRAMAVQRYARESLVAMATTNYNEGDDIVRHNAEARALPGLRLTRPVERERDPEETDDDLAYQADWDLTSARGGLDWTPPDA